MLLELENYQAVLRSPWMLVPVILLVLLMSCFQIVLRTREVAAR